jgi:hypothetical protein
VVGSKVPLCRSWVVEAKASRDEMRFQQKDEMRFQQGERGVLLKDPWMPTPSLIYVYTPEY